MTDLVISDRNAELATLACCLLSATARAEAKKTVTGSDFFYPQHETVWDAITDLERRKAVVDEASVMSAVQHDEGARLVLIDLLGYPTIPDAISTHARTVREWAVRRRLHAEAMRVQQVAFNPEHDIETEAASAVTRFTQVRNSGTTDDAQSVTLNELLTEADDEPDWLIPGLLERRDRFMLTGEEGLGKSYLLRQIAVMVAAGLDPFEMEKRLRPARVLIVDCENTSRQVKRKVRPVVELARKYGTHDPGMVNLLCSSRVDITRDRDLARLHLELDACQPEIVVIGPLYRLTSRALQTDDEAAPVLAALDTLRDRGCALLIEAHAGHAIGKGGTRDLRPRGSSALLGWPEFGFGLRSLSATFADVVPWRGMRDERDWPGRLRRANDGIRWIPVDPDFPVDSEWS